MMSEIGEKEERPELAWLDDPRVFQAGRLPAHSDHKYYADRESYARGEESLLQCLDGTWQFHYSKNAAERPVYFYEPDFDASAFDEIKVPGHVELAGYGRIHYINTMYPWDGQVYRRPEAEESGFSLKPGDFSAAADNPVSSYRTVFDLAPALRDRRISLRFDGVEQAFYVWLNGRFIGYAEDSFSPAEFDLTEYVRDHGNVLAVEVYKCSSAAYLEDQDFFRFSGIFRSVYLCAKPCVHIEDLWAKPACSPETGSGTFALELKLSAANETVLPSARVSWRLMDAEGETVLSGEAGAAKQLSFKEARIDAVHPWAHGTPYLYQLELSVTDADGRLIEVVPYRIGFRDLTIRDRVMYLNGTRLIINGVNRHEWSAEKGRAIGQAEMESDIACLRRNHINAVRTSHYPNQSLWYSLCDAAGIYVMAETNLESHGSWQKMGAVEPSWNVPGSHAVWLGAVLDRASNNFERLKNHASILFWSLGNESYAGACLAQMQAYFKEKDSSRLVHYEGVYHAPAYKDRISDVESQMYAPPGRIRAYFASQPQKPFLLCEYMHDMGNSLGGFGDYMALLDEAPGYQGGFLWDLIDQALFVEDKVTGKKMLCYGGDFDDRPSDYAFSGNGLLFADRTEKPAMQEVRYYFGKEERKAERFNEAGTAAGKRDRT